MSALMHSLIYVAYLTSQRRLQANGALLFSFFAHSPKIPVIPVSISMKKAFLHGSVLTFHLWCLWYLWSLNKSSVCVFSLFSLSFSLSLIPSVPRYLLSFVRSFLLLHDCRNNICHKHDSPGWHKANVYYHRACRLLTPRPWCQAYYLF